MCKPLVRWTKCERANKKKLFYFPDRSSGRVNKTFFFLTIAKEIIFSFYFHDRFLGKEKKSVFTTVFFVFFSRGRLNKLLFILCKCKYTSSNTWLLGSFSWQRTPSDLRDSQQIPHTCPSVYHRIA